MRVHTLRAATFSVTAISLCLVGASACGGSESTGTGSSMDAGGCPASAPTPGSPCSPSLYCTYGSVCCGGGYTCGMAGTWEQVVTDCACMEPLPDAGSVPCGSQMCLSNQVCVHPATNFCGPAPQCSPLVDAGPGQCPDGYTWVPFCAGGSPGGCAESRPSAPPSCQDIPSSCGGTPSCSCLPQDVCGGGADRCTTVQGRDVNCLCLAP